MVISILFKSITKLPLCIHWSYSKAASIDFRSLMSNCYAHVFWMVGGCTSHTNNSIYLLSLSHGIFATVVNDKSLYFSKYCSFLTDLRYFDSIARIIFSNLYYISMGSIKTYENKNTYNNK